MQQNGARYEEDEFNLLRKYFIACLNLGYLEPKDLVPMVNKFASVIKLIVLNYNNVNKMDYYMINGNVLYISGALKDSNDAFYEINFYKAVSEVVLKANEKHIGISSALCEMLAEKIHNMDTNGSRIIMPRTVEEQVGNDKIELRAGYINYNLIISLAKQLFISMNLNENKIINRMFFEGFDIVLNDTFNDKNIRILEKFKESDDVYNFNGVKISRRKVLRRYSVLKDNNKDSGIDALLYCIIYGSMLDENELKNIYDLIIKICKFDDVQKLDSYSENYVDGSKETDKKMI